MTFIVTLCRISASFCARFLEHTRSGVCFKDSINRSVFYSPSPHGFIGTRLAVHFSNGFGVYLHGCAVGQCGWPVSHPNAVSHNECISKLNEILFFFFIIFFCTSHSIDPLAMPLELDLTHVAQCQ